MKGRAIKYSAEELAFIEARKNLPRKELHASFVRAFGRDDVSQPNLTALCKRKGWLTGRTGRFQKGMKPWNKGKKMPFNPNSAKNWFRKGQRPHNTKWEGHENVRKDGYVWISVRQRNQHTGFERRYVLKHKWLWERENGPLPKGYALKCLDGNRRNTDPDNWVAIPRAMLPLLAGKSGRDYDSAPASLKPVIMATARLQLAASKSNTCKHEKKRHE